MEGAAGTGKTSALDEAARFWEKRGHKVIRAHGSELDRSLPFGIVAQLFEPVLDDDLEVPPEALGALRLTSTEPDFIVLQGLYRLAVRLAGDTGLLIVVDDVHWADAPSLRWLAYLALRMRRQPISLVLSIGADERCDDPSFCEVVAQPLSERIVLGEMDLGTATELAERVFGGAVDRVFVEACLEAADGNPQLTARLFRALADDQVPPEAASAWQAAEHGTFVRGQVVLGRLRRRPPRVVTAAQCAAVLGPQPHPGVLAELTGMSAIELTDALRTLNGIGALGPQVRSAVLDDMPAASRADLHARAARSLRNHGADDRAVAEQLLETPPGADAWACEVLDRAARDAVSRGDPDAAARLLWRSLREPLANPARAFRLLGVAELTGGLPGATARLREALAAAGDPVERAQTAIPLAMALHADGRPAELVSVLDSNTVTGPLTVRVREHRLMHAFGFAEAVPSDFVSEDQPVNILYQAAIGRIDAHSAAALTSRVMANRSDTLGCVAGALTLCVADHHDEAIALTDRLLQTKHTPATRGLAFVLRSNALRRRGDLTAARADADAAESFLRNETRWPLITAIYTALRVDLLMEASRVDDAHALLESACADERLRSTWSMAALYAARGRVNIVRGDPAAALEDFLAARDHEQRWPFRNPALLPWRAGAALACAALSDGQRARQFADEELANARAWGAPRLLGMTLRAGGRVYSGSAGRALLEAAVVVLRASSARLELARALTDLGVTLRRQGDTSLARTHLRDALDLAQKSGSEALSARAYAELVATGSGPRRMRQTGPTALTPTEHQVANLAARGRSNEEIATTLLVPAHTIEGLLLGACRKLGVAGRLQLPEVLDVAD
ncbi:transcriptional regulator [Lentzea sp. NBRC 105346]|nr:transcriptional regulator [Lentzea sp. NBRC 105346]